MRSAKRKTIPLKPLHILRIQPGDMVVYQTDLPLDKDQARVLGDRLREQVGSILNVKTAVITAGKLAVLRKRKNAPRRSR